MSSRTVLLGVLCTTTLGWAAPKAKVDYRKTDRELQARNAARLDNGGRIRLELLAPNVIKDRRTFPPDVVDGNTHSRQVVTGADDLRARCSLTP